VYTRHWQSVAASCHQSWWGVPFSGGSRKKIFGGPGPSSFGRQQRLSKITIEPIKNFGAWARFGGRVLPLAPTQNRQWSHSSPHFSLSWTPQGVWAEPAHPLSNILIQFIQSNSLIKSTLMFNALPGTEISVHAEFSH